MHTRVYALVSSMCTSLYIYKEGGRERKDRQNNGNTYHNHNFEIFIKSSKLILYSFSYSCIYLIDLLFGGRDLEEFSEDYISLMRFSNNRTFLLL